MSKMATVSDKRHDDCRVLRADEAEQSEAISNSGLHFKASSPGMRKLFMLLGSLFVCLGIIGIILPLVPTTPFLLLAAACYARSSEKYYNWLLNHRWFGEYLRNYQAGRGIPMRVKVSMLLVLWTSMILTATFVVDIPWVRILLLAIAAAVTVHMCYLPTFRPEKQS